MSAEPALERGWVSNELRSEFPAVQLLHTTVPARAERTPPEVRARVRHASDRFNGAKAIALRQQPIPWAYRVFFRQIGIDPDERRTPIEGLVVERLRAGGFKSRDLVADAVMLAIVDTGIALQAFDADRIRLPLGLRAAEADERLGGDGAPLVARRLVIADAGAPIAVLFGETSARHAVGRSTERALLAAVQVAGVPAVAVEEALWAATDILVTHTRSGA